MKQSVAGIHYQDKTFLIGKRLPGGDMGGKWEFPGGKVDQGETPEVALCREFREEFNFTVQTVERIARVFFSHRGEQRELLAYTIQILDQSHLELTEHSEIRRAALSEIEQLDFVDSDQLLLPDLKRWVNQ